MHNKEDLLTQEKLKELLHYDPDTGVFTWLERPILHHRIKIWNTKFAGEVAGCKYCPKNSRDNYYLINIGITLNKKHYVFLAHRLAWLYMTGKWPKNQIDHINGDAMDNRFVNLRDVDYLTNRKNMKLNIRNRSGFNGVTWCEGRNRWRSYIKIDICQKHLGYFKHKQDAIDARKAANIAYGFHENHGGR